MQKPSCFSTLGFYEVENQNEKSEKQYKIHNKNSFLIFMQNYYQSQPRHMNYM
jgi:hypothetical protein